MLIHQSGTRPSIRECVPVLYNHGFTKVVNEESFSGVNFRHSFFLYQFYSNTFHVNSSQIISLFHPKYPTACILIVVKGLNNVLSFNSSRIPTPHYSDDAVHTAIRKLLPLLTIIPVCVDCIRRIP